MLKYEYLILQSKAPRKTRNFLNKVTKIKKYSQTSWKNFVVKIQAKQKS
jgi:hypothetical protein